MKNRRLFRRTRTPCRRSARRNTLHRDLRQRAAEVLEELRADAGPGVEPRTLVRLRRVDPLVFEQIVLQTFARIPGYRVRYNQRLSGDGGVDGRVYDPEKNLILVQCKRVSGYISARDVTRLVRICRKARARGVFAHTGRTGPDARTEASQGEVEFLSGAKLVQFIRDARTQ